MMMNNYMPEGSENAVMKNAQPKEHKGRYVGRILAALIMLIAAALVIMLWSSARLISAMANQTGNYVSDTSAALSNDINQRLENVNKQLEFLEDSIINFMDNDREVTDFLNKEADILGFNAIAVASRDGRYYCTDSSLINVNIYSAPGIESAINGKSGISFLNEQAIMYSIPLHDGSGKVVGALSGVRDKKNMQKLIAQESFSGKGMTCVINAEGEVVISPADLAPFIQLEDIFSQDKDKQAVDNIEKMQENIKSLKSGTFVFEARDGKELVLSYQPIKSYDWVLLTLVPADIISHETDHYIKMEFLIIIVIITLFSTAMSILLRIYRNYYRQLERAAFTDRLTGGMNNAAFQLKCRKLLQNAKPDSYAVVYFNINKFKLINENFGSEEGDKTLRYIYDVLTKNIQDEEVAARLAADNFYLCLKESDEKMIRRRMDKIISDINSYNDDLKETYYLNARSGAYIVEDPSLEITVMQDRAKTACINEAEADENSCTFYDKSFTQRLQKERKLNNLFEDSIAQKHFRIFYQPKVWLESGETGGAEALIRWFHPQEGVIYPGEFIPLFEKNGKICKIDLYVFEEVCRFLSERIKKGLSVVPVSVNLSRQNFKKGYSLENFVRIAERYNVPKSLIEIELTESIFFDDNKIEYVKKQIDEMHKAGFLCSLDDFGSGFSSLGMLMDFDVDIIKIDKSFFEDVSNPKTKDIISSVMNLSKKIGTKTVAEGIENEEQLDFLKATGCDLIQGYIFSKPLQTDEFENWLETQSSRRTGEFPLPR